MGRSSSNTASYPRSWWLCMWSALACALWLAVCPPAEARCTDPAVQTVPFRPVLDTTRSHAQLTAMAGGKLLVGAVVTARHVAVSADGCTVTLGWAAPVIYIAAELTANRCAMDHVMAHEMEHVRIYTAALEQLPQRVLVLVHKGMTPAEAAEQALIEVREQHAAHDNDDELDTNRTACGRRIPRLLAGL